jgi:hypothetical protein
VTATEDEMEVLKAAMEAAETAYAGADTDAAWAAKVCTAETAKAADMAAGDAATTYIAARDAYFAAKERT